MSKHLSGRPEHPIRMENEMENKTEYKNAGPADSINKKASYASWGRYIKTLRDTHFYSQAYVADYIGMSSSAYGYHERGERMPTPAMIVSLAVLYNVNVQKMLSMAVEDENPRIARLFVYEEADYAGPDIPVSPDGRTHELITEQERHLLEHYRSQPQAVRNYIDGLIGSGTKKR